VQSRIIGQERGSPVLASYDSLFIGGEWIRPSSSARIDVTSASTEENIGSVPEAQEADVDAAVAAARRAFDDPDGWSQWEPSARAAAMERLAVELEARAEEMARRVSAQNGMPISIATMLEGGFPVIVLRYLAGLLEGASFEEEQPGFLGGINIVRREPIGVVGAIVPWNYPQTLAAFKYGAALAAGCTVVMKPSPETVLDAFLLAEAIAAAGIPAGVINIVPGGRELGAYLVAHRDVDKVAFTGSTAAGRRVAETCGRLLRPVTLELGGKSAAIVLDDADLDLAKIGNDLFAATLVNNGQTCYLGTRVLAPRSRYDEVVDTIAAFASSLTVGDALDPATQIGPMASQTHRDRVEGYVSKGASDGARLVVGGGRPRDMDRGWFVEPTVFADVDNSSTIAQEEIFGPVLSVIAYGDVDDAIRIANDSDYGLGGSVWTTDDERGKDVARRVRTGTIGINKYLPDPAAPFGGIKASGIGRELGPGAISAYQQFKSIYT
jgi:aldehyde dehydrogenase (NAD+)